MSENSSRPTRQAKKNAIGKVYEAVPKERKYKKTRKKEDQAAKTLRQRYRQLGQEQRLARQQVEQERHAVINLVDDDESEDARRDQKKDEKEEVVPFECVICSEEILDVLSKAISEGKGGVDGGLAIWSCDQKDCGALFCISCVNRYITGPMARSNCPACRREWNLGILRDQARAYDPELLGDG
ncbi:hypothetical protein V866_006669 [Kwoniella sp. B9012]